MSLGDPQPLLFRSQSSAAAANVGVALAIGRLSASQTTTKTARKGRRVPVELANSIQKWYLVFF